MTRNMIKIQQINQKISCHAPIHSLRKILCVLSTPDRNLPHKYNRTVPLTGYFISLCDYIKYLKD